MSATEPRRYTFSLNLLFLLASLIAFIAAFCFAEGWLTVGSWQEFIAAGLALHVIAELA